MHTRIPLLCALWWTGPTACVGPPERVGPPVTALITIDTWRHSHFSPDHTPTLWSLAGEGERFDNAWSPIGLTSPSHATMLTGLLPWEHGMEANNHHGYTLADDVPHVLEHPRFAGLPRGAFVSAYPAGPEGGLGRGFDIFDGPESSERAGEETVRHALEWLPTDQAAFLWVHVYEPHGPYVGVGASDVDRYAEEVRKADRILAPLLQTLVDRGATIVVAADHGEVLLEEKCGRQHERSTSSHVLHVPLFRWTPKRRAVASEALVGLEDVPQLLLGESPTVDAHRLAESGICEPGCSPGCGPSGVAGRDRVAFTPGEGHALLRAGSVRVRGHLSEDALQGLRSIPPVPAAGRTHETSLQALGYTEP